MVQPNILTSGSLSSHPRGQDWAQCGNWVFRDSGQSIPREDHNRRWCYDCCTIHNSRPRRGFRLRQRRSGDSVRDASRNQGLCWSACRHNAGGDSGRRRDRRRGIGCYKGRPRGSHGCRSSCQRDRSQSESKAGVSILVACVAGPGLSDFSHHCCTSPGQGKPRSIVEPVFERRTEAVVDLVVLTDAH